MLPAIEFESIQLAVLTVSPNRQYLPHCNRTAISSSTIATQHRARNESRSSTPNRRVRTCCACQRSEFLDLVLTVGFED